MISVGYYWVFALLSFTSLVYSSTNKGIRFFCYVSMLEIDETIKKYIFHRKATNGIHFGVLGVAL